MQKKYDNAVLKTDRNDNYSEQLRVLRDRYFDLFEYNHIPFIDIPYVLPQYNLTLSSVLEPNSFYDALSPEYLYDLAQLFCINLDWLKGVSDYCYENRCMSYVNLELFSRLFADNIDLLLVVSNEIDSNISFEHEKEDKWGFVSHEALNKRTSFIYDKVFNSNDSDDRFLVKLLARKKHTYHRKSELYIYECINTFDLNDRHDSAFIIALALLYEVNRKSNFFGVVINDDEWKSIGKNTNLPLEIPFYHSESFDWWPQVLSIIDLDKKNKIAIDAIYQFKSSKLKTLGNDLSEDINDYYKKHAKQAYNEENIVEAASGY